MARETPVPTTRPTTAAAPPDPHPGVLALGRAVSGFWRHGDLFTGAAISFYALFSLLPLTILFGTLINLAFPHAPVDRIFGRLMGDAQHPDILALTVQDAYDHRRSLGWLGSLTLILAAGGVFTAVQIGLDRVFECRGRLMSRRFAVGVLMMIGSLLIFFGVMVGTVFALRLIRISGLAPLLGLPINPRGGGAQVLAVVPAVAQFAIFWVGYRFLPNVRTRWRDTWPGAALAAAIWQITNYGLGWYVARFADYTSLYHSLGVVVALLSWIYALACTFLFGAEFVAAYGPDRPVRRRRGGIPIPGEGDLADR